MTERDNRIKQLEILRKKGINPYPNKSELPEWCQHIRPISDIVRMYEGFTREELEEIRQQREQK